MRATFLKYGLTCWNSNFKSIVVRKDVWLNIRRLLANVINNSWICQKQVEFKATVIRTSGFVTNRVVLYASQLLLTLRKLHY